MIVGNDVSRWQGDIDFSVYKHNTNFLIIKATEGTGLVDLKFSRNQAEARANGIPLGYYHFARPDLKNSPEMEANYFLKAIGPLREGEFLCLDYEPASNPYDVVDWCKRWLEQVFYKTGVLAFIYLNKSQVKSFDWTMVAALGYPLWLASYNGDLITGVWQRIAMQQWTSSQKVPGISGNVDGNWFFGEIKDLLALGYKKPVTPSSSPSPSNSPSASVSPSVSSSPSASPSPSEEEDTPEDFEQIKKALDQIQNIIDDQWTWFGANSWKNRRKQLQSILG